MKSKGSHPARPSSHGASSANSQNRRKLYIFTGLLGALVATSAVLMAMSPAPLKDDTNAPALAAYTSPPSNTADQQPELPDLHGVLDTRAPVRQGTWRYIFVHHSRTAPGPASLLGANPADHFIITAPPPTQATNSQDDGRIEMTSRWENQTPALPPAGASSIHPQCISITLVGDFDRSFPTHTQFQRTLQLVRTLQRQLNIPAENVLIRDDRNCPSGTGKLFPVQAFRDHLLR